MYACLASTPPPAADARGEKDTLVSATARWRGQYSDQLLETIDWCLCLNHFYRPQSVFALQKALATHPVPPAAKPLNGSWLGQLVGKFRGEAKK